MKLKIIQLACIIFFVQFSYASNFKVIMNVNGHEYAVEDEFVRAFDQEWNNRIEEIEEDIMANNSAMHSASIGKIKSIKYRPSSYDNSIKTEIKIKNSKVVIGPVPIFIYVTGWFDIEISIFMHSVVNEKGLVVIFDDFTVSVSDIRWNNVYFYLEDLESYFENEITSSINSFLPKDSSIVLIPLSKFAEMYGNPVVEDVDPVELVESVISSFPFNYSFNYRENGNFDNLVVNVDLLPGYNEPGKESIYLSGNPTLPSTDNILDKAGISTVGTWPFPLIDYQNTLDWDDEIYNYCADVGAGMGLNYIRLGAKWNIVIPSVDEVNPVLIDNFPEITSPDINDYIRNYSDQ